MLFRSSDPVDGVCNKKFVAVTRDFAIDAVRAQMLRLKIEAIPVLSSDGVVVDVLSWSSVFSGDVKRHREALDIQVVIMAGGKGSRLEPFTSVLPKPLIPIGEKTVIEHIMDRFHQYAVGDFLVSLNYKAGVIRAYLKDLGKPYRIRFFEETEPLGTAGALKLMGKALKDPFIVINCDVLMDIDHGDLVRNHRESKNDLTLVTCCKHYVIPYGVCEIDAKGQLRTILEKPEQDLLVNTGLYVMSRRLLALIPAGKKFDMPQLLEAAKRKGLRVGVFPVSEKAWQDVGQWDEFRKVNGDHV